MASTITTEILKYADGTNGSPLPHSLSERAYRHIRRKIISTELPPGAVIDEGRLKSDLEMGRTPIREALQRLSTEKLVTILPRRGMLVTEISVTDLHRLFEVRFELEGLAAFLASIRATSPQLDRMEAVLSYLPEKGEPADPDRLIAIDEASHRLIYQATDNKFLIDTLSTLYGQSLRLWYFTLSQVGPLQDAVEEHALILQAMKQRNGEKARSLIQAHVQTFHEKKQAAMAGTYR